MEKEKMCPICNSTEWDNDVTDVSTGFIFCGGCFDTTITEFKPGPKVKPTFSTWLRSIADSRDAYAKSLRQAASI